LQTEFTEADFVAAGSQAAVTAFVLFAELCTFWLKHRFDSLARRLLGRLALGCLFASAEHFAFEDPHLDADYAIGGVRLREAVVDVGTQGVQRYPPLAIPLATPNLRAVQPACHVDLDALRPKPHRVRDRAFHGAAEHDALFELLRNAFGHQLGVEFRLPDFLNVDVDRDSHQVGHFFPQRLDILALPADHDAR